MLAKQQFAHLQCLGGTTNQHGELRWQIVLAAAVKRADQTCQGRGVVRRQARVRGTYGESYAPFSRCWQAFAAKLTAGSDEERGVFGFPKLQGIGQARRELLRWPAFTRLDASDGHNRAANAWRELF